MGLELIREDLIDPIYCGVTDSKKIEFRLGGMGQGEGRRTYLSPKEAVAIASKLLLCAEEIMD